MALFAVLQATFLLALLPLRTYQSEGKKWKEQLKKNHKWNKKQGNLCFGEKWTGHFSLGITWNWWVAVSNLVSTFLILMAHFSKLHLNPDFLANGDLSVDLIPHNFMINIWSIGRGVPSVFGV